MVDEETGVACGFSRALHLTFASNVSKMFFFNSHEVMAKDKTIMSVTYSVATTENTQIIRAEKNILAFYSESKQKEAPLSFTTD